MSRYSLFVGALCVLGCFARPHGGSSEQQDGPQGMMRGGSMMGGPMMAKVMAAMANNPFLSDLSDEQRAAFFAIKMNTTLTKGQIVSAVNEFLQSLSADIKNDYTVWQANVTQWKTNMINKIKSSVSADAQAVIDKIQGIMEDQSLTYKDTCHGVLDAVNETSSAVKDELKAAAKANFGDALQAKMGARMGNGNGNAQVGGSAQGPQGGAVVNMRGGAGVGAAGNGNPSMGAPGMGGPGMGRPGMGGPGMGGPGMGGPNMGGPSMGGPGMGGMPGMRGDPCEMMENIVEHLGKMASVMHGVDNDDDNNDDVAAAVPAAPAS